MKDIKGKYALVTGGTNGIGYEIAKLLAADGCNIILVARNNEPLLATADELKSAYGVQVICIAKDLFMPTAPREIYDELKMMGVEVCVLVNNAGQGQWGPFAESDLNRQLDIIQLNVITPVQLTRLFLQDMVIKNEGAILNLASIAGKVPSPLLAVYAATKAFILHFSESIREELKDTSVTITALLPGRTDTDFFRKADAIDTIEYQEHDLADPAEVAKDGYEALMEGKDKVVSGLTNKMIAALANVLPDEMLAANMHKNMKRKPIEENNKVKTH